MKKRVLAVILSLVLIFPAIINDVYAEGFEGKVNSSDIIKYSETHNTDLRILKEKIELKQEKYDDTQDGEYKKYTKGDTRVERAKVREVYPYETELDLNNLKWEQKQKIHEVSLEIKKKYYNILIQDKLIQLKNSDVQRLEKQINQIKKKIAVGVEAQISLMNYQILLEEARLEFKILKDTREKFIMGLNITIGREPEEKLILDKEDIPYEEYKIENLDKVLQELIKNHYTIQKVQDEKVIASLEYSIYEKYNKSDKYYNKLKDLDEKFEELRYDNDNQKRELESKLRSDYNNLTKMNNNVLIAKIECNNKKKLLEAAEHRKELGYITEIEYIKYEQDMENALKDYEKAKIDYYIAVEDFKFFINK